MGLSFSIKAFSATIALLLVCATIWAGSTEDLIKSGDDLDLKLKASEALDFYLAAESWIRRTQVSLCASRGNIAT